MAFFSNPFALFATVSLTIQIVVLGLLFYGYWLKNKLRFSQHGKVMGVAVFLHLAMIFFVMLPAFAAAVVPDFVLSRPSSATSIVSLVHAPLGVIAVSLGLWFVVSWRIHGLQGCFEKKKFMVATMAVWLVALGLGIVLYLILYWSSLVG